MARDLQVTQPTVWRWLNQSKQLPAEYVLKAAELYSISPSDLRPDLYPRDLGQRFYGVAFVDDEPELPLADECCDIRPAARDGRAANGDERFTGVDRRASRVPA